MTNFTVFDASDHLDSEEAITEYLTACLETDNNDLLFLALANVAKARGMTRVAEASGLNRESLYKALAPGTKPGFDTIRRVMSALGVKLTATAIEKVHA